MVIQLPKYCPKCGYTDQSNLVGLEEGYDHNINITNSGDGKCPKCGTDMKVPDGNYIIRQNIVNFVNVYNKKEMNFIFKELSEVKYHESYEELEKMLKENLEKSDLIIETLEIMKNEGKSVSTAKKVLKKALLFIQSAVASAIIGLPIQDAYNDVMHNEEPTISVTNIYNEQVPGMCKTGELNNEIINERVTNSQSEINKRLEDILMLNDSDFPVE